MIKRGYVREIDFDTARPFIRAKHYAGDVAKGAHLFFGWYVDCTLYAVADFGNGVNPYAAPFLTKICGEPVAIETFRELTRLCRVGPRRTKAKYPLSQFLSACHRLLSARGYRWVVAFSDPAHQHTGGIYRASGYTHAGQTQTEYHNVTADGAVVHRRKSHRLARATGVSIETARKRLRQNRIRTMRKDRWVKAIGPRSGARQRKVKAVVVGR